MCSSDLDSQVLPGTQVVVVVVGMGHHRHPGADLISRRKAEETQGARGGGEGGPEHPDQGGLAGAVGPEHHQRGPGLDVEIEVPKRPTAPVAARQLRRMDGHCRGSGIDHGAVGITHRLRGRG